MWTDIFERSRTNGSLRQRLGVRATALINSEGWEGGGNHIPIEHWSDSDYGSDNKLNSNRLTKLTIHMLLTVSFRLLFLMLLFFIL